MTATATTTPSVCEILSEGERLIREVGWCQHASARTANGLGTGSHSERAVAFCISGACHRAARGADSYIAAMQFIHRVTDDIVIDFNDAPGRTKEEVLAKFAEARKLAGCPD